MPKFLYDFLSVFIRLESKILILIMSLKKQYVQFLILICLMFPVYMFNKLLFEY